MLQHRTMIFHGVGVRDRKRWDEGLKGWLVQGLRGWSEHWSFGSGWVRRILLDGKGWSQGTFCIGNQESKLKIQRNTMTSPRNLRLSTEEMEDSHRSKRNFQVYNFQGNKSSEAPIDKEPTEHCPVVMLILLLFRLLFYFASMFLLPKGCFGSERPQMDRVELQDALAGSLPGGPRCEWNLWRHLHWNGFQWVNENLSMKFTRS